MDKPIFVAQASDVLPGEIVVCQFSRVGLQWRDNLTLDEASRWVRRLTEAIAQAEEEQARVVTLKVGKEEAPQEPGEELDEKEFRCARCKQVRWRPDGSVNTPEGEVCQKCLEKTEAVFQKAEGKATFKCADCGLETPESLQWDDNDGSKLCHVCFDNRRRKATDPPKKRGRRPRVRTALGEAVETYTPAIHEEEHEGEEAGAALPRLRQGNGGAPPPAGNR